MWDIVLDYIYGYKKKLVLIIYLVYKIEGIYKLVIIESNVKYVEE